MIFLVESLNNNGKKTFSFKEAQNIPHLFELLKKSNTIATGYYEVPTFLGSFFLNKNIKLRDEEVIEIIEGLALIIKSGIPLYYGLLDIANDSDNEKFRSVILSIANDIQDGKSLAYAFSKFEKSFTPMVINLIKVGEESGQLHVTLQRGSFFLRRIVSLKKKVKQSLIYPVFAFVTTFGAMLVWLLYVLPQMSALFKQMNVELPPLTLAIIGISDFLQNYIFYVAAGIIGFIIAFKYSYQKSVDVRIKTAKLLLKIPVVKHIILGFNMAFVAEYLKIALTSGLAFYSSLENLHQNIQNELFKKAIKDALGFVSSGYQLSYSLKQTGMFAPFMVRLLSQGEESGTLEDQFDIISQHYNDKVDYYAENISKLVEPVMLVFVGGFMALIMMGLMGPMYDIITKVL